MLDTFLKNNYKTYPIKFARKLESLDSPPYTSKYNPIEHRFFPHV